MRYVAAGFYGNFKVALEADSLRIAAKAFGESSGDDWIGERTIWKSRNTSKFGIAKRLLRAGFRAFLSTNYRLIQWRTPPMFPKPFIRLISVIWNPSKYCEVA